MKVFLSYASEQAEIARAIEIALRGEGHVVFLDRSSLVSGETYNDRIREALAGSDLFVFLISPEAVAKGRYTLTELEFAEERWPHPGRRVLPVIVSPTALAAIPVYLRSVTILDPAGNVPAAVAATVARLGTPWWRRLVRQRAAALLLVAALAIGIGGWWSYRHWLSEKQVGELLATARLQGESGNRAAAWDTAARAAALAPRRRDVALAQERAAMDWLDHARVTSGKGTFTAIVDKVHPVLARCAVSSEARRAADCLAHLGWGDFLRAREGAGGLDPVGQYRRAAALDPDNVYANAMWGFEILRSGGPLAEANAHFARARASGRQQAFARSLQIAGLIWRSGSEAEDEIIRVANDMRMNNEVMPVDSTGTSQAGRLWNVYYRRLLNRRDMDSFLSAVSGPDHLDTFRWLFPEAAVPADKRDLYLFMRATLEERAGDRDRALATYRELRNALARAGALSYGGPLPEGTVKAIERLSKP
jgi:hypothetical protein